MNIHPNWIGSPETNGEVVRIAPAITFRPTGTNGRGVVAATLPGGKTITDKMDPTIAKAREGFADLVCKSGTGIDRPAVVRRLEELAAEAATPKPAPKSSGDQTRDDLLRTADAEAERLLAASDPDVRAEAEVMLSDPLLMNTIAADFGSIGVAGERVLAMTVYLVGVSRLLEKPTSAIIQGGTSTGKTHVPLRVARLVPPEALVMATEITQNALYYFPAGHLMHRFVVGGERPRRDDDDRAEATRALREMIESGELHKAVPVKTDDRMETAVIRQYGPIAFIESTTSARIFDEDANRCLLLGTDEGENQTAAVVMAQARAAMGHTTDPAPTIARHHAMQRMLRRVRVNVPFADRIAERMPKNSPEARRALPMIVGMIRTVALLHQRQRAGGVPDHGDVIEAVVDPDYTVARALLVGPMGRALGGGLPGAVERFGHRLVERFNAGEAFTTTDAIDNTVTSRGRVAEYLRALEAAGAVESLTEHRGSKPATWRIIGPIPDGGARWLPAPEELGGVE